MFGIIYHYCQQEILRAAISDNRFISTTDLSDKEIVAVFNFSRKVSNAKIERIQVQLRTFVTFTDSLLSFSVAAIINLVGHHPWSNL